MTLSHWFEMRDIDPESGLCVSFGTDGFDPDKAQLMSISTATFGGDPLTYYIKQPTNEADVSKVEQYTGVSKKKYTKEAIYFNEALENLQPVFDEADFIISYACKSFYTPWVEKVVTPLVEIPVLDLQGVFKLKDRNGTIREDLNDIDELNASIEDQTSFMQAGYSLSALAERFLGTCCDDSVPALELKPKQLQLLFALSLQMIF